MAPLELEYPNVDDRPAVRQPADNPSEIRIGNRLLATQYFLAPLAGYTHLAFRRVVRECGGVGLATTDLVQASHLLAGTRWARELVATHPDDRPLSVQIYGGVREHLVNAAKWLEEHGYHAVDINMGCPMAKITGQGGGARLMCDTDGACSLIGEVVSAVTIPVTVKMRLGWDRERISAPALAPNSNSLAWLRLRSTAARAPRGSAARSIWKGYAPWLRQLRRFRSSGTATCERSPTPGGCGKRRAVPPSPSAAARSSTRGSSAACNSPRRAAPINLRRAGGTNAMVGAPPPGSCPSPGSLSDDKAFTPTAAEQIAFLTRHFELMVEQHGEFQSCRMFRKFAAWCGAQLGIPEDLEDRLRRFESIAEFEQIIGEIRARHGARRDSRPTAEIKVPNGPVEYW